jgi:hypothetical protein
MLAKCIYEITLGLFRVDAGFFGKATKFSDGELSQLVGGVLRRRPRYRQYRRFGYRLDVGEQHTALAAEPRLRQVAVAPTAHDSIDLAASSAVVRDAGQLG